MINVNYNWKEYLYNYPDLIVAGIKDEESAKKHWINHGKKENRIPYKIDYFKYINDVPCKLEDIIYENKKDKILVQSFWYGKELSNIEVLCINSFLKTGHIFHLYCYENVKNVPNGTVIKDASEILNKEDIFFYGGKDQKGSVSAFSNMFRYKLLLDKGGYWVDMDMVCLRQLDINKKYVFSSEVDINGKEYINAGIIKVPKNSDFAKYAYQYTKDVNKDMLKWGKIGPNLVSETVKKYNLLKYVRRPEFSCPLHYCHLLKIIENDDITMYKNTYCIHMWNQWWNRLNLDKNGIYKSSSFFEKLKNRYN